MSSEKQLQAKVSKHLAKMDDTWFYKIPDPARCLNCGNIAVASKRPFDYFISIDGYAIALELKAPGIKFQLASHQLAQLRLFALAGGFSLVYNGEKMWQIEGDGNRKEVDPTEFGFEFE